MPEKSVGFAIGNLRARENRLLKKNDLSGFAAANNVTELARMLRDKGIGKSEEDVLSYALFPQVAVDFFKYREAQQTKVDATVADTENGSYPV